MTLDEFISTRRGLLRAVARKSGLSESSVSRLASGKQVPSLDAMRRIQAATNGAVTAADWLPPPRKRRNAA